MEWVGGISIRKKTAGVKLCIVLLCVLWCGCLLRGGSSAYAAPPHEISGMCSTKVLNPGPTNNDYNLFAVTMPDGEVLVGHCIDYGHAAPADGAYSFSGTWNGSSYDILVHSETASPQSPAPTPCQRVSRFTWSPQGVLELEKQSSNTSISDGNGCYALAGASYGVYEDDACSECLAVMETDEQGHASLKVPIGTYWVKELAAPEGFAKDDTVYQVEAAYGSQTVINGGSVFDRPQCHVGGLLLSKIDAESACAEVQGDASFEGALFSIDYYDGYYEDEQQASASGSPGRSWVFKTDETGKVLLDDAYFVSGDEVYRNDEGAMCLPLGTVVIRETKAPRGYECSEEVFVRQIVSGGESEAAQGYSAPVFGERIIRGGVLIEKRDAESGLEQPLGAAHLEGAVFQIKTLSENPVIVGGVSYRNGDVVARVSVEGGCARTESDALPFGRYSLQELSAGEGYLLCEEEQVFSISEAGLVRLADDNAAYNQVKRGDISFVKVRAANSKPLAGIPFLLTSKTSGERHLLVSDGNGQVSTSSSLHPHSSKTNASDAALGEDGTVDESLLVQDAGIWFGMTPEATMVKAQDNLSALPYDIYTLEELPVAANEGLELVSREFVVTNDGFSIDGGTIENVQPSIATTARDAADGDRELLCDTDSCIIDRVLYCDLDPASTYRLEASLVLVDEQGEVFRDEALASCAELSFSPDSSAGYVEVSIPFDSLRLGGKKLVVFEKLYDASGRLIASHEDAEDEAQTLLVRKPDAGTDAKNPQSDSRALLPFSCVELIDTVSYRHVVAGKTYHLEGVLMDRESGTEVLDGDGNPIVGSCDFTPEAEDGQVEVLFSFDASSLQGRSVVVFETLSREGVELAVHADLEDERQTVRILQPCLHTSAFDSSDGDKRFSPENGLSLCDTVRYEGLLPGWEYRLEGFVFDKDAGELIGSAKSEAAATCTFVPDAEEGETDMVFSLDLEGRGGHSLVVFEYLYCADGAGGEVLLASHADKDDEAQTVAIDTAPASPGGQVAKTGDERNGFFFWLGTLMLAAVGLATATAVLLRGSGKRGTLDSPLRAPTES